MQRRCSFKAGLSTDNSRPKVDRQPTSNRTPNGVEQVSLSLPQHNLLSAIVAQHDLDGIARKLQRLHEEMH